MSATKKLSERQAALSENNAFQIALDDERTFQDMTKHLSKGSADIMVVHGPPDSCALGKAGKDLPGIMPLIERVRPSVFICGHSHNGDLKDLSKGRWSRIDETSTSCVNAACVGTWNQRFGTAVVLDHACRRMVASLETKEGASSVATRMFDLWDRTTQGVPMRSDQALQTLQALSLLSNTQDDLAASIVQTFSDASTGMFDHRKFIQWLYLDDDQKTCDWVPLPGRLNSLTS